MAKAPKNDAPSTDYVEDEFYIVTLNRAAEAANEKFRVDRKYRVKGKVATELGDAIETSEHA